MIQCELASAEIHAAFDADFYARERDEYGSVVVLDLVADARFVIITDESQQEVRLFIFTAATSDDAVMFYCDDIVEAFEHVRPYMTRQNMTNID